MKLKQPKWQKEASRKILEKLAQERWEQLTPMEKISVKAPMMISPKDAPKFK